MIEEADILTQTDILCFFLLLKFCYRMLGINFVCNNILLFFSTCAIV